MKWRKEHGVWIGDGDKWHWTISDLGPKRERRYVLDRAHTDSIGYFYNVDDAIMVAQAIDSGRMPERVNWW